MAAPIDKAIKVLLVSEGLPNTTLSAQVTLEAAEQIMRASQGRTDHAKKSASQELAADRTTALFFCAMLVVAVIYIVAAVLGLPWLFYIVAVVVAVIYIAAAVIYIEIRLSRKLRSGVDDPGAVHRVRPWPGEDDGVPEMPDPEQGQMMQGNEIASSPCVRRKWEDDETEDPEETDKILTGH
jgi:hypothetical protein